MRSAFLQIRRHMDAGDGVIDVIELDGETVTALAQLFTSPYLYSGLLGRFVNLDALLEYLAEEHVSGSVVVQTPNEAGIILLRDGDILGTYTESQRSLDKATTAVAALANDRQSSHRGQGRRQRHRCHRRRRRAQPRLLAPLPGIPSRLRPAPGRSLGCVRADRARSPVRMFQQPAADHPVASRTAVRSGVAADAPVTVEFDRPVDDGVGEGSVLGEPADPRVRPRWPRSAPDRSRRAGSSGSTGDTGFTLLHPRAIFAPSTSYTFTLAGGISDPSGVVNSVDHHWTITTGPAPVIRALSPG